MTLTKIIYSNTKNTTWKNIEIICYYIQIKLKEYNITIIV